MNREMTHESARQIVCNLTITDDPKVLERDSLYILVDDIQDVIEAFVKDGYNDHGDNDVYEFLDRHGINWK